MKRVALALTLMLSLLFSATLVARHIGFASAQMSIIIKDDGSVYPSTSAVQRSGNLYTVLGDVEGIEVQISNIKLDGNGQTIKSGVGGIILKNVENVTVKNFIIKGCHYGVYLSECSNITVSNNTITGTEVPVPSELTKEILASFLSELTGGIVVRGGNHNTISGNRLENNVNGMDLTVEHCIIFENAIINNTHGVILGGASSNIFYHNNFINNYMNVVTYPVKSAQVNTWDDGSFSGGNYWSGYNGVDANGDGISGTPYIIDSNNQDLHPLMKPWEPDNAPPNISISSPENKTYYDNNILLTFSTGEPNSKISYSLDEQGNVTITGNITLAGLPVGVHNVTVYASDAVGNVGVSETTTFTIAKPFPVVPVAAASAASFALLSLTLLVYFKKLKR